MIFYDPTTDAGALRLNVAEIETDEPADPDVAPMPEMAIALGATAERLGAGHWFVRTDEEQVDDDGTPYSFVTYYNMLVQPERILIALFSSSDHRPEAETMLEGNIRQAKFEVL